MRSSLLPCTEEINSEGIKEEGKAKPLQDEVQSKIFLVRTPIAQGTIGRADKKILCLMTKVLHSKGKDCRSEETPVG